MDLRKRFGKRIKELRKMAGYKQSELAELVGIATKTQSSIECGINFPKVQLIEKYAKVLKVDVPEILYLCDTPTPKDDYTEALYKLVKLVGNLHIENPKRILGGSHQALTLHHKIHDN